MLARALARHLTGTVAGVTFDPDGTTGNTFIATMPDAPDVAVMVSPYGGLPQPTRRPVDEVTVQVMTRGAPFDPVGPFDMAQAIYGQLACLDHAVLDEGGADEVLVLATTPLQSGPVSIGRDENDRHEYTVNAQVRAYNPTAHRPAITA